MTAKEKASELVEKYSIWEDESGMGWNINCEKQCALIAVDEILRLNLGRSNDCDVNDIDVFYKKVKQEIEKL